MCPDLQCDPAAWHPAEDFLQRFRTRSHPLLQLYLSHFIQHTVPAVAISQIQSDGQCCLRKCLTLPCRHNANLLHCRSPLSLVPLSTSIIWERTASRRRPAFSSHLVSTINLQSHEEIAFSYAAG